MKTAELEGAQLALWVARALGLETPELCGAELGETLRCEYVKHEQPGDDGWWTEFDPHKDWSLGGPIIDDHAIGFHPISDAEWLAEEHITACTGRGSTPLIAAMRAFVASIYGDTVPDVHAPSRTVPL